MTWKTLLRLIPHDLRDPIAGDIEEERAALRDRVGPIRASAWAWWTAARLAMRFRLERVCFTRRVPPIADEIHPRSPAIDSLRQDVGFSLRLLRRQPGFTTVAVLALALGIGATTAIVAIVDAVLWRPLPYPDATRIISIAEQRPREGRSFGPVAPADFFDWRSDARTFASMAAYLEQSFNMTGRGEPERLRALDASPGFLDVIQLAPSLGRTFRLEEERDGRNHVLMLTDGLWRRRFAADPAVIGRTIALDGNPYEIVAVLPSSFWWPTHPDLIVPLALDDHDRTLRGAHFLDVIGRLRESETVASAREELAVIGARLAAAYPEENQYHAPNMRSLRDDLVGDVRLPLLVLLGAAALLLAIACANVATLLIARSAARQRELAIRRAVGASRGRMVRQMVTESLVLSMLGGVAGVLVAVWSLGAFRAIVPAQFAALPGIAHVTLDLRVLAAAMALSALTGVVFGIVPALAASSHRLGETRAATGGPAASRLRTGLVIGELALSLVLLIGSALLIVSFVRLMNVSTGFQPERLVTTRLTLPGSGYAEHTKAMGFYEALLDRARALPGVQRAALTTSAPFSFWDDSRLDMEIQNRPAVSPMPVRAQARLISLDYFRTLGIPLLRGRTFTVDDNESSRNVVIINEAAAKQYWPGQDPIGARISLGSPARWMEIVGIVGSVRGQALDVEAEPEAYMPMRQPFLSLGTGFERSMTVVLRTTTDTVAVTPMLRTAVAGLDPQQPVDLVEPMTRVIAESLGPRRLNFVIVAVFAVLALVLTAAGLYGVMSYLVAQRTREIGVRMALGATSGQTVALVMRQAALMTAIGLAIGLAGALALTRSMQSLLYAVSPADPLVYAGVVTLLAAVALAAAAIPSRSAARVDPLIALRDS